MTPDIFREQHARSRLPRRVSSYHTVCQRGGAKADEQTTTIPRPLNRSVGNKDDIECTTRFVHIPTGLDDKEAFKGRIILEQFYILQLVRRAAIM